MIKTRRPLPITAWVCTALIAAMVQPVLAAPHTPKPSSAERKAIMDAMRKVVGKGHKKKVIFTVADLNVEKGWAYYAGHVTYADGSSLGEQYLYGNLSTVLHLERKRWVVKLYRYHGDVIEEELIEKFPQAPRAIFKRKY